MRNVGIIGAYALLALTAVAAVAGPVAEHRPAETAGGQQPEPFQKAFQEAAALMNRHQFEDSLKKCKEALAYQPKDSLTRALMCLDFYEIAETLDIKTHKAEKIRIYEEMARLSEDGIRYAPAKGECYFFRGLAHARLSTTNGVIYSLFMAKGIERDWLKAAACQSDYTTPSGKNLQISTNIALGSYYRLCPSSFLLSWVFGISGDLDKAVAYCRRAYQADPCIEVTKEYGVSLVTRGLAKNSAADLERGKALLRSVPGLPQKVYTDAVDIEHSRLLLAHPELCPGYSRDQQQEISEAAYFKIRK
jgi:tetratricopeptide (TPR) repeat protein